MATAIIIIGLTASSIVASIAQMCAVYFLKCSEPVGFGRSFIINFLCLAVAPVIYEPIHSLATVQPILSIATVRIFCIGVSFLAICLIYRTNAWNTLKIFAASCVIVELLGLLMRFFISPFRDALLI